MPVTDRTEDATQGLEASAGRVLLIDDDAAILGLLAATLQDANFTVAKVLDGLEGLHLIRTWLPDVVVLDVQMPVMDGHAFFKIMRARAIRRPVLILSAHEARQAAAELGADDWLEKPFDADVLVERVRALIARRDEDGA